MIQISIKLGRNKLHQKHDKLLVLESSTGRTAAGHRCDPSTLENNIE